MKDNKQIWTTIVVAVIVALITSLVTVALMGRNVDLAPTTTKNIIAPVRANSCDADGVCEANSLNIKGEKLYTLNYPEPTENNNYTTLAAESLLLEGWLYAEQISSYEDEGSISIHDNIVLNHAGYSPIQSSGSLEPGVFTGNFYAKNGWFGDEIIVGGNIESGEEGVRLGEENNGDIILTGTLRSTSLVTNITQNGYVCVDGEGNFFRSQSLCV